MQKDIYNGEYNKNVCDSHLLDKANTFISINKKLPAPNKDVLFFCQNHETGEKRIISGFLISKNDKRIINMPEVQKHIKDYAFCSNYDKEMLSFINEEAILGWFYLDIDNIDFE